MRPRCYCRRRCWSGGRCWSSCWGRCRRATVIAQPVTGIHYHPPPMPALVGHYPEKGCDADCRVTANDGAVRDQRVAVTSRCHLCCSRCGIHDVLEVVVEFGHACHERMSGIKGAEREGRIEDEIRGIAIRIIVAAPPSAVDSIRLTRSSMTEGRLHKTLIGTRC